MKKIILIIGIMIILNSIIFSGDEVDKKYSTRSLNPQIEFFK
ncbi:hypothetical protein Marpi_0926 [Marinitoga piezophila KA3]|uniref:Uncharacterized protein n=1 Tax=Marinitoga piezophila (strain DSM 14283 / JCM 11233 / KA3) TaxID=443254 RepID=H2J7E8_MARPK|nr:MULTISPECIES: hypothetical protein [Marinitoga]AEX85340.1 hypothetical protein Marpi_0926 [Marinitoga piezophila KA3]